MPNPGGKPRGRPKGVKDRPLKEMVAERKAQRELDAEEKKEKSKLLAKAKAAEAAKRQQKKHYQEQKKAALKANAELANRELARRKLIPYIRRFDPEYEAGWVHHDICRRLEKFYGDVANKRSPRLMLFVPPRHGKSYIASDFYPSWCLGKNPRLKFIAASYAVSLPIGFSRNIRDRITSAEYKAVFRNTAVSPQSKAAEAWETTQKGAFIAAGVGGGITGKGADIFVIDDPIKDAEEADSEVVRDKVWDWYGSTAYTRLSPGGGMLIIQCMTGDTPVLRPDGSETRLDEIRPGDMVATFDGGRLTSAKVLNWASQGEDDVFVITTTSGKIVRANARHPFLVETERGLEWVRLKNLQSGQKIVTVKGSGVNGGGKSAAKQDATSPHVRGVCAPATTTSGSGLRGIVLRLRYLADSVKRTLNTGMGLLLSSISNYWIARTEGVLFAGYPRTRLTPLNTGNSAYVSTTTPVMGKSEDCSATTATYSLNEEIQLVSSNQLCATDDFTTEEIVTIEPDGVEEVFDIEVEGTHNFIANVIVVSNTRWHDDDLSGRAVAQMQKMISEGVEANKYDHWEIIEYPAEATSDEWMNPDRSITETPSHEKSLKLRNKGDALHPERFPITLLHRIKSTLQPRHWSALYQQNPVPEEGIYFTKDMFHYENEIKQHQWEKMNVFIAGDLAIGEKQTNDYTALAVGGLDYDDQVHILKVIRFRRDTFGIVEALLDLVKQYNPYLVGIEKGQLEHAIKPQLAKRMKERRIFPTLAEGDKALKPIQDKMKRARPLQGRMQQGMVHFPLPERSPWVETVQNEMLRFPGGVHDDMVDALAWLIRMMMNEEPPKRPRKKKLKSFRDKLNKFVKDDPRTTDPMGA